MTLTTVPDKAIGDVFTEAMWDTFIKDNLNHIIGMILGTQSGTITRSSANATDALRWLLTGTRYAKVQPIDATGGGFVINGTYNGSAWNRDDTAAALTALYSDLGFPLVLKYAASGANPASPINALLVDTVGKLTGSGFYASSQVSVGNGVTQTFNHGLTTQPRFVFGYYDTAPVSGVLTLPVAIDLLAAGAVCKLNSVSTTQIAVTNSTGGTRLIQMFAML